ncbi:hypothetical protein ACFL14_01705 [Patescibacteria group bacterium]
MKNIYKYFLTFLTIFVISFGISSAFATGDTPIFNHLNGDYKTFRGANHTQGEKDWHNPVQAKLGDVINWNIYLHNGVEGTTAHNVKARVELPENQDTNHTLQVNIQSDDTNMFSDSAELIADQELKLNYVSGSTELWDRNGHKVKDLPDGIVDGGINIGDIQGCWPYAVFIVFKTNSSITPQGQVDIYKLVRNVEKNEEFSASTIAKTTDTLEYKIIIENNTNHRVDFKIIDHLPKYVSYIQDSLLAEFNNDELNIYETETELFDTYKQLHLEEGKILTLTFEADINSNTPIGTIFTNKVDLITPDDFMSAEATTTIISSPILGKVGEVLGASTLPVTGNPITVSLALAFAATCVFYTIKERNLLELDLRKVRALH